MKKLYHTFGEGCSRLFKCAFASLLAASRRSSLYGAVRRKEKLPFASSNSMQPVSGSASVRRHSPGLLPGVSSKPLFWVGVVGADIDGGAFFIKPNIGGQFFKGFLSRLRQGWSLLSAHRQKKKAIIFWIENNCSWLIYSVVRWRGICSTNWNLSISILSP